MTREDLITAIANRTHFTIENSTVAANAVLEILTDCLKSHEKITFHNMFMLKPIVKSARTCVNPRTRESIYIPPKNGYKFILSPKVSAALNADKVEE